ncbi:MAG TPA: DNA translocase FtsK 4TM domain-containing protein, partial [Chloroflexota bacterium]|nr:DNA translocase FtsK 4TM domain-containing protein [Chloroflexota bacterium]
MNRRSAMPIPDEEFGHPSQDNGLLLSILLVVAFFLSILVIVLPGGAVGRDLRGLLGRAFGWGSYLAPVILAAFTTAALRGRLDSSYRFPWPQAAGWLVEFWSVVTLLQPLAGASQDPAVGGGLLGRNSWILLASAFGGPAATAVTLAMATIALALLLGLSFSDIASWASTVLDTGARATIVVLRATLVGPRRPMPVQRGDPVDSIRQLRPSGPFPPTGDSPFIAPAWLLPQVTILKSGRIGELSQADLNKKIQLIEKTLADFDVYAKVVQVSPGPAITQFGLEPGFRERTDRNGTVVR